MISRVYRYGAALFAGAMMLTACQDAAPPAQTDAEAAADEAASAMPVKPGVYGNVGPNGGLELQLYGPPRDMLEFTLCEGPCRDIRRASYQVAPDAVTFSYRDKASGEMRQVTLKAQGEDATAQTDAHGAEPMLLKRLPGRTALAAAQEAMVGGGQSR